ncbi:General transcription factor IIH subunit 3 [Chionoecetes opilio]|uniref:General transcription factor IIH subunit 3 n=1 Tax=Chionoecetes opilio TaxID=41210 RepID=A0A8J4XR46_CHIOP|nr:General transcription factor IIH subunit 3 [Chionoecetes opilio]
MSEEGCLLVMVVDLHPQLAEHDAFTYLNAVVAFANLHLAANVRNSLAVLAANHLESRFLYPSSIGNKVERQKDGRLEMLGQVDRAIERGVKAMTEAAGSSAVHPEQSESLLSGAMGRGLLYIKRREAEEVLTKKIQSRLLVLKVSSDTGSQYLTYINAYLTSQKILTPVDVCVVGGECGLLQQGADITGGTYYCVRQVTELLQTLLLMYHCGTATRRKMNAPPADTVDYRAACFCHRTLVDMASVCSNCLSVYCKAVPLCTTCNVIFQTDRPLVRTGKKKK